MEPECVLASRVLQGTSPPEQLVMAIISYAHRGAQTSIAERLDRPCVATPTAELAWVPKQSRK